MLRNLSNQNKQTQFFLIFCIVLITIVAYFPSLTADFVNWDDDTHLYENPHVKKLSLKNLSGIFTTSVNKIYIPLTTLSFALEYHFVQDNPFLYHLNNLILHILITVLVFFMTRKLGLSNLGSAIASLIFAIHPIHVESVAWVTERKDVLYAFFYMASTVCYLSYLEKIKNGQSLFQREAVIYFSAAVVLGLFSMLAKPMALSLPIIFLLIDWFYKRSLSARLFLEKVPIAVIVGLIGWLTYSAHAREFESTFFEAILIWIWTFSFYIKQFIFPLISVPLHSLPKPVTLLSFEYISSVIVLGSIVGLGVKFRANRWFLFAIFYYLFSIFFLLRFDDAGDTNIVADRWMYLPCLGFCVLIGYCVQHLFSPENRIQRSRNFVTGLICVFVVVFTIKTFQQSKVWRNSVSLWQHQLYYYPNEPIALNNLANFLRDKEEFKESERQYRKYLKLREEGVDVKALDRDMDVIRNIYHIRSLYRKAVKHDPDYRDGYYNLGNFYKDIGIPSKAIIYYNKTISLDPLYADAYFNLAKTYLTLNDIKLAEKIFDHLISLDKNDEKILTDIMLAYNDALKSGPINQDQIKVALNKVFKHFTSVVSDQSNNPASFFNLGYVYQETGKLRQAEEAYLMALALDPNHVDSLYNLANLYESGGNLAQAIVIYQKILSIDSNNQLTYMNLGVVYSRLNNYREAKAAFERAVQLNPDNADAHFNLGYIYEVTGQSLDAIEAYNATIEVDKRHAEAYYNRGNVYAKLGQNDKAIESYLGTISHNPMHINALVNLSIFHFRKGQFKEAIKYCDEARVLGYAAPEKYLRELNKHRK